MTAIGAGAAIGALVAGVTAAAAGGVGDAAGAGSAGTLTVISVVGVESLPGVVGPFPDVVEGDGDRWWRRRRHDGDRRRGRGGAGRVGGRGAARVAGRRRRAAGRRRASPRSSSCRLVGGGVAAVVVVGRGVEPSVGVVAGRRGRSVGRVGGGRRRAAVAADCADVPSVVVELLVEAAWPLVSGGEAAAVEPLGPVESSAAAGPAIASAAATQQSNASSSAALCGRPTLVPTFTPTDTLRLTRSQSSIYQPARPDTTSRASLTIRARTLRERGWDLPPGKTSLQSSRKGCSMGPTTGAGRGCAVIRRGG